MTSKFKRAAAALSALVMTASLFGCARGAETESESGTAAESVREPREPVKIHAYDPDLPILAAAYLDGAPTRDLGGMDIFFTGPQVGILSPDGATYISKEVAARNEAVEKKLNVKIDFSVSDEATMYEDAATSVASGLYYTDVMLLPVGAVGRFYSGGCLFNLSSLPFLDLSRPYFDGGSVTALSAGNSTLAFSADACPPLADTPALFYDAEAVDRAALERAAEDGTLTWDLVFEEAARSGIAPVSGASSDLYGAVAASIGGRLVNSGRLAAPTSALTAETASASAAITARFNKGAADQFGGGAPFYLDYIKNASSIDGGVKWGILPVPKAAEEDGYRSLVSRDCPVFTVVAGTKNSDEIGLTLSAFCAASYGVIPEHYVDELIVTEMRDDGSGRMLDIIRKTAVFDLSLAFSGGSEQIFDATVGALRRAGAGETVDIGAFAAEADAAFASLFG